YDVRKNYLFGSRDRTGVKPFYYYKDEGVFAFASEQKALLKLPFVRSGINLAAASAFLVGDIQFIERGNENMFKNIFELMPAQNFKIDLRTANLQIWNYYSLKSNNRFSTFKEDKFQRYRDETERLLVDSVKLRLRSDVPVGSCLSGGIDSSAIVCIMEKLISQGNKVNLGGKLNVFTLKFEERNIDESHWAKYVVDQTHAEWNLVSPTAEDLLSDFRDLNYAQDIPVCSTGTYGQFQLMRRAKEKGIRVILDGQGGDELFGGYFSHSMVVWKELLRRWKLVQLAKEAAFDNKPIFNFTQLAKDFSKRQFVRSMPYALQAKIYTSKFRQNGFINKNLLYNYISSGNLQNELEVSNSATLN
ncbi:MAG TPA: asparagine synthase-related protein, partial [Bacteroidia bacterium]